MDNEIELYREDLKNKLEALPPEVWKKTEVELKLASKPSLEEFELKNKLWEEMASAQEMGRKIYEPAIYKDICSKFRWKNMLKNQAKLAWLFSPLVKYEEKAKALLEVATDRYLEILNMDIGVVRKIDGEYISTAEVDPKKASIMLAAIKNLEDRVKGTSVQKSVSIHTTEPKTNKSDKADLNIDLVNEKIKELEQKLNKETSVEDNTNGYEAVVDTTAKTID